MSIIISCEEPWFSLIKCGRKTVEGKKGTPKWSCIRAGDVVIFELTGGNSRFKAKVTGINRYIGPNALRNYLLTEGLARALPGVATLDQGVAVYLQYSSQEEIDLYGMIGIQIKPIDD